MSFAEFTADVAALGAECWPTRGDDLYAVLPSAIVDQYMPDRGDRHPRHSDGAGVDGFAVGRPRRVVGVVNLHRRRSGQEAWLALST